MKQHRFSVKKRLASFGYALDGLRTAWREEHNIRIHVLCAGIVVVMGILLRIAWSDWCILILCIGSVISVELINSSIENIADFVSPERHIQIKKIKDLSAAAVLIASATALLIGLIIFIPKIISLIF